MRGHNPDSSFIQRLKKVSRFVHAFNRLSMGIAASISDAYKANGLNQKRLAELFGKKESEISKWLSGKHNFTIKTVALIEDKLKTQILYTKNEVELPFGIIDQPYEVRYCPKVISRVDFDEISLLDSPIGILPSEQFVHSQIIGFNESENMKFLPQELRA